ncbi:uncharacterized protein LOC133204131 [Saccostrea echinata]|uniref:uncharacterized protein LOC133204131 n=1 Tax=Saccostrea echinata TaxID=191078 RepID=UPI002A82C053|nr:uncharacterized protein LOC133204131 [Saccostrea echinata]
MRYEKIFTLLLFALCGKGYCIVVRIDNCNTSKSYVNHSLPDRPEFYRSIHLQKVHLVGESFGTVVFCLIHEIYMQLKYLETRLPQPMDDIFCSRPCKRSKAEEAKREKSSFLVNVKHQMDWSNYGAANLKILKLLLHNFVEYQEQRPLL